MWAGRVTSTAYASTPIYSVSVYDFSAGTGSDASWDAGSPLIGLWY